MQTLAVETLRSWLDEERPVSIVDVRPQAERQEWTIPGSLHLDAYAALRAHDPEALAALELPADRPVVTVCAAGKTSQLAAEQLAIRGLEGVLAGGRDAGVEPGLEYCQDSSRRVPVPGHPASTHRQGMPLLPDWRRGRGHGD